MTPFRRRLPEQLVAELQRLAANGPNWWTETLSHKRGLYLAIRDNYLNAYVRGQSVFRIQMGKGNNGEPAPVMTTHYKYLLKPSVPTGKAYVAFNGTKFLANTEQYFQTCYQPNKTIDELVRTAISYADKEKSAVDIIAAQNQSVVDLEIGFSEKNEIADPLPTKKAEHGKKAPESTARRIDLAAILPVGSNQARLVFYEVKRLEDSRLKRGREGKDPEIFEQLQRYDAFVRSRRDDLKTAYETVCKLRHAMGLSDPVVRDVAEEKRDLVVDNKCRLIVLDYAHREMPAIEGLKGELRLKDRLLHRGKADGLNLVSGTL